MITRMTLEEKEIIKNMVSGLAQRWGKRLNISAEVLIEILDNATVEVYQERPFTTAIIKKTVSGKHIRGAGFTKYNLDDTKLGGKYAWNEQKGRIMSINRAFHNFIDSMSIEGVLKGMNGFKVVEEVPTIIVSKSQERRLKVQAVVEQSTEVLAESTT